MGFSINNHQQPPGISPRKTLGKSWIYKQQPTTQPGFFFPTFFLEMFLAPQNPTVLENAMRCVDAKTKGTFKAAEADKAGMDDGLEISAPLVVCRFNMACFFRFQLHGQKKSKTTNLNRREDPKNRH